MLLFLGLNRGLPNICIQYRNSFIGRQCAGRRDRAKKHGGVDLARQDPRVNLLHLELAFAKLLDANQLSCRKSGSGTINLDNRIRAVLHLQHKAEEILHICLLHWLDQVNHPNM